MNSVRKQILYGFSLLAGMSIAAAEIPQAAKPCVACHNEDGISHEPEVPTISGASAFYLENQLVLFKERQRPCVADTFESECAASADDHCALAEKLSKDEMTKVTEYYASLPFKAADQQVDQSLAEQGASIHEKNCARCHTDAGSLALDDSGILAGQWKPYLIDQIKHYQTGERWKPKKGLSAVEKLEQSEIKALAEFYAREGSGE
ncbi:MAG: c-type cytochrome [Wenzhouxiangellaceae bacterium]|nr:c-type cytochrome [Wenzhouxiangellaceae bacterium]